METKITAVLAYNSPLYNHDSNEPETPITSKNFTDSIEYRARDLGRLVNVEYAEGFTTERYVAVSDLGKML